MRPGFYRRRIGKKRTVEIHSRRSQIACRQVSPPALQICIPMPGVKLQGPVQKIPGSGSIAFGKTCYGLLIKGLGGFIRCGFYGESR